jgi:hypothetical protein
LSVTVFRGMCVCIGVSRVVICGQVGVGVCVCRVVLCVGV